jgi:hypothetical protein
LVTASQNIGHSLLKIDRKCSKIERKLVNNGWLTRVKNVEKLDESGKMVES